MEEPSVEFKSDSPSEEKERARPLPEFRPTQPLPPFNPFRELLRTVRSILWSSGFLAFLALLVLNVVIVLALTPEIQHWISTPYPSPSNPDIMLQPQAVIFVITPVPVGLFAIAGGAFQAWHLLLLGILVASFGMAKLDLFKSWLSQKGAMLGSLAFPRRARSSLETVAKLFMASIFFSTFYFLLLDMIGVSMRTPAFEELSRPELIYGFFSASVFEELISRVLLIGVPLVLLGMLLDRREYQTKLLGGGMALDRVTLGLITFSAVFFALAHVSSWDFSKVPQVFVIGFALGYAFMRFGLHASILIHFSINLNSVALDIWPDNTAVLMFLGMSILIWLVLGAYFFADYSWRLAKMVMKMEARKSGYARRIPGSMAAPRRAMRGFMRHFNHRMGIRPSKRRKVATGVVRPKQRSAEKTAPPAAAAGRGFVCPECQGVNATYDNGRLTCTRCKTVFGQGVGEKAEEKQKIEF